MHDETKIWSKLKNKTETDNVDHPPHYNASPSACTKCGEQIECIDVTRWMNFNLGNAIKYIWRADHKGKPVEDLEKAIWYIRNEIDKYKTDDLTS